MTRLDYITSLLKEYNTIADVGTDHGFVPISAIKDYNLSHAYALDINDGPLLNCKQNIMLEGLMDKIDIIKSDGLKEFDKIVDAIVIAGMGGELIKKILSDSLPKALKAKALILSPNKEEDLLRKFLINNGFVIALEHIIYDHNHFYEIIKAIPGDGIIYSELDIKYGPYLRREKSDEFIRKWTRKLHQLELAYKNSGEEKKEMILSKINSIKEIL